MGYRSEVKYVIKDATDTGKLKDYISYLILQNDDNINEALSELKVSPDYNYIFFESDWTKWYTEYESVQAHTKILSFDFNYFTNEDSKLIFNSLFIRIGEDNADIENETYSTIDKYEDVNSFDSNASEECSNELLDVLNISRHINMNYDHKLIEFKNLETNNEN